MESIQEKLLKVFSDGKWHDRRELMPKFGLSYIQIRDAIRDLDVFKNGELISGNKGWRLVTHATSAELDEFTARLRSQARTMLKRIIAVKRARKAA